MGNTPSEGSENINGNIAGSQETHKQEHLHDEVGLAAKSKIHLDHKLNEARDNLVEKQPSPPRRNSAPIERSPKSIFLF